MRHLKNGDIPKGNISCHPWEKWLCGKPIGISRGIDFDTNIESMRKIIRTRADRDGYKCRVHCKGDEILIIPI